MPIHPLERLKERYRGDYTEADLRGLETEIHAGNFKLVAERERSTVEYLVTYKGRRFRVVYSPVTRRLVTVLPLRPKPQRTPRTIFRDGRIRALVM